MDARILVDVACVAFGAGSFCMGYMVSKLSISQLETRMADQRRVEREWARATFVARPGVIGKESDA